MDKEATKDESQLMGGWVIVPAQGSSDRVEKEFEVVLTELITQNITEGVTGMPQQIPYNVQKRFYTEYKSYETCRIHGFDDWGAGSSLKRKEVSSGIHQILHLLMEVFSRGWGLKTSCPRNPRIQDVEELVDRAQKGHRSIHIGEVTVTQLVHKLQGGCD